MTDAFAGHHIRHHIRNALGVIGYALQIFGNLHDQRAIGESIWNPPS